jgi:hypothetical protein
MWIFSQDGFYSIVQKGEQFHVRTRRKQDLVNVGLTPTKSYAGSDYPWRANIVELAENGLDPAHYRAPQFGELKVAFLRKLLPKKEDDPGHARTLTAQLLLETLHQHDGLSETEVRTAWYIRKFADGRQLEFSDPRLDKHARRWSALMGRQYQRYAIELFLWCFEEALSEGAKSVQEVIEYWVKRTITSGKKLERTFAEELKACAGDLLRDDELATSRAWNDRVLANDNRFEYVFEPKGDEAILNGLQMLAGWYWRMLVREKETTTKELMDLGKSDRMSMSWFLRWLKEREDLPIQALLNSIFSELIFAQHIRTALSRYDGHAQKVRFLLGDGGIEPTVGKRNDFAQLKLPWMPDRLHTLISLLCDCDVIKMTGESMSLGTKASDVLPM